MSLGEKLLTAVPVLAVKLKTFTGLHSSGLVPSFETVISNMMSWDVISRSYITDPSDSTKKVLSAVTIVHVYVIPAISPS
jgi:hypothetical protein